MRSLRHWAYALAVLAACATPAFAETGQTCIATDNQAQAMCMAMIGAVRGLVEGEGTQDPACAAQNPDDLGVNNDVIAWIKSHPERADDDLAGLIREALISVDPCAQGPLIPTPAEPSDLDVD